MQKVPSVMIGTPRTKPMLDGYVMSLWETRFKGETILKLMPDLAIDVARDYLVGVMKENECDALLWADVDATWHPDAIQRLWDRNKNIVAGCMYRRALPPIPTIGWYKGLNDTGKHLYDLGAFADVTRKYLKWQIERQAMGENFPNDLCFDIEHDGDLLEVDGCGSHFIMIRKEVFEAMPRPWYKTVTTSAGEDYWFCRKAKEAGFKIHVDLTVHTGHEVGTDIDFGAREFMAFFKHTERIDSNMEYKEKGSWE